MSEKLMNRAEYAEHAGVSTQTVSNWINKGKITEASLKHGVICSDGKKRTKIIPHLADKDRAGNLSESAKRNHKLGGRPPGKTKPKPKPKPKLITAKKEPKIKIASDAVQTADDIPEGIDANMTQADAERIQKIYKAATAQVEYLEKRKKLVNRQEDRRKVYEVLQQTMTDLSSLPRKSDIVAGLVAAETPEDVEDILARTIFELRSDLADTVGKMKEELGL